jgi:hypothetical protein
MGPLPSVYNRLFEIFIYNVLQAQIIDLIYAII